jgi:ABC-type bacteriocin/lantibiotic exporter with double-glycine peptidase domain
MLRGTPKIVVALFAFCGVITAGASGLWLDVPFVKQEKNACGAASIAMVMQYWQRQQGQQPSADAEQIQNTLYSQEAHGIFASDLERYFQQHGFRTFAFRGDWDDLKQHLEKGRPLIVALKPSGGNVPLHYVVVAGIDWSRDIVLVNDPAERKLLPQEKTRFESEWKAADNWTLLAVPFPEASSH